MAIRQIYIVKNGFVEVYDVDFTWFPGFSISQKQKSIEDLHNVSIKKLIIRPDEIIEISSKSQLELGIALSAFNLKTKTKKWEKEYSVETAFQSSKVFENGGPYIDILDLDSRSAKKDSRIRNSGKILYFEFCGNRFEASTGTAFYDWLYINVLLKNPALYEQIINYRAFTDIEFNSKKSLNTQAFSVALFVSLHLAGTDMSKLKEPESFLEQTRRFYNKLF